MTTKAQDSLSPPGNTIEIFTERGAAGMININPCRTSLVADEEEIVGVQLVMAADEDDDDGEEELVGMILLVRR